MSKRIRCSMLVHLTLRIRRMSSATPWKMRTADLRPNANLQYARSALVPSRQMLIETLAQLCGFRPRFMNASAMSAAANQSSRWASDANWAVVGSVVAASGMCRFTLLLIGLEGLEASMISRRLNVSLPDLSHTLIFRTKPSPNLSCGVSGRLGQIFRRSEYLARCWSLSTLFISKSTCSACCDLK